MASRSRCVCVANQTRLLFAFALCKNTLKCIRQRPSAGPPAESAHWRRSANANIHLCGWTSKLKVNKVGAWHYYHAMWVPNAIYLQLLQNTLSIRNLNYDNLCPNILDYIHIQIKIKDVLKYDAEIQDDQLTVFTRCPAVHSEAVWLGGTCRGSVLHGGMKKDSSPSLQPPPGGESQHHGPMLGLCSTSATGWITLRA